MHRTRPEKDGFSPSALFHLYASWTGVVRSGARGDRARWHGRPAVARSEQNTAGGLGAVSSYPWIRNCPLMLLPARAQRADFEWYLEHPEEGRVASNETDPSENHFWA